MKQPYKDIWWHICAAGIQGLSYATVLSLIVSLIYMEMAGDQMTVVLCLCGATWFLININVYQRTNILWADPVVPTSYRYGMSFMTNHIQKPNKTALDDSFQWV